MILSVCKFEAGWPCDKNGAWVSSHLLSAKLPVKCRLFYRYCVPSIRWLPVVESEKFLELLVVLWLSCFLSVCYTFSCSYHSRLMWQLLYSKYQHDICCPSIESFDIFHFHYELTRLIWHGNSNTCRMFIGWLAADCLCHSGRVVAP